MAASKHTTRAEILRTALDLFCARGVQQTSMQDIAGALGISKPALYHHFTSRHDLVAQLLRPMVHGVEAFLREQEAGSSHEPYDVLGGLFDVQYEFRAAGVILLRELAVLSDIVDNEAIVSWRGRVRTLLVGEDPSLADRIAAELAIGGLAECVLSHADLDASRLREPVVRSACAALAGRAAVR